MEIVLVKQTDAPLTELDSSVIRRFLFEYIDGSNEKDTKAWRRFWNWIMKSEQGEYFTIKIIRQRSGPFHRRHMKMESEVFKNQSRFEDFRIFRSYLKVGSNFVDYIPNADGELIPVPKSISFDDCSEEDMRQFHEDAIAFLRSRTAQAGLWPHLTPTMADLCVNAILEQFERGQGS